MKSPSNFLSNWAVVFIALLSGIILYQCENRPHHSAGTQIKFSLEFSIK